MDRMLGVVFDTEAKAFEGKKALLQLETREALWFMPSSGRQECRWLRNGAANG